MKAKCFEIFGVVLCAFISFFVSHSPSLLITIAAGNLVSHTFVHFSTVMCQLITGQSLDSTYGNAFKNAFGGKKFPDTLQSQRF